MVLAKPIQQFYHGFLGIIPGGFESVPALFGLKCEDSGTRWFDDTGDGDSVPFRDRHGRLDDIAFLVNAIGDTTFRDFHLLGRDDNGQLAVFFQCSPDPRFWVDCFRRTLQAIFRAVFAKYIFK